MNKVILIGNLTKDPEMGETANGIAFCKMTVAVNRRMDKGCDFLNCTAWRTTAENCGKYLSKGKKICVVGSIQINSYETSDGSKRYLTEIQADEVEFLSQRESEQEESEPKQSKLTAVPEAEQYKLPF